jgi:hypothetical protein
MGPQQRGGMLSALQSWHASLLDAVLLVRLRCMARWLSRQKLGLLRPRRTVVVAIACERVLLMLAYPVEVGGVAAEAGSVRWFVSKGWVQNAHTRTDTRQRCGE